MAICRLVPLIAATHPPSSPIVVDAIWAHVAADSGIEHIYARVEMVGIWIVFLHRADDSACGRACDAATAASPALRGWIRSVLPDTG